MSLSLTHENLSKYVNPVFIETGTFHGGGVKVALSCRFDEIHSIEIYEPFQVKNMETFKEESSVHLYVGDSETLLWNIIKDINKKITFFLDSHVVTQTNNLKGIREIPLLQELDIIKQHSIKEHTIMIDDRRMMGYKEHPGGWVSHEWESILEKQVMDKIFEINPNYKITYEDTINGKKDIIVAYI
jgi:hypothetical protein